MHLPLMRSIDHFHLLPLDHSSFTFRFLQMGDQSEVKSLCDDWFPLKYPRKWYNDIIDQEKYFSLSICHRQTGEILSLLVASHLPLNSCSYHDQQILPRTFLSDGTVCYILVLGVRKDYRRQGLASLLLEHLYHTLNHHPSCQAIYLHVLHSNQSAIEFYRSQQFQSRFHLRRFYQINHEYFDAFCFVRYIHSKNRAGVSRISIIALDGYPPLTLKDLLEKVEKNVLGRKFMSFFIRMRAMVMQLCFPDR